MALISVPDDDLESITQAASEGRNVELSVRVDEHGTLCAEVVPAPAPFKYGHLEPQGVAE